MSTSPAPRWFGSFVLAPLVWVLLIMPGPSNVWSNLQTDRFSASVRLLGMIYGVMLIAQLVAAASGAVAMLLYFGTGWGGSKVAGIAFLVTFPFMTLFVFIGGIMGMAGSHTDMRSKSFTGLEVLADVPFILKTFPWQIVTTLAIAAAFALWIARSSPRA